MQDSFKADLRKAITNFKSEVRLFKHDFDSNGPMLPNLEPAEGMVRELRFQRLYEEKSKKMATFNQGEDLFGLDRTIYAEMEKIKHDLSLMGQLYTLYMTCTSAIEGYNKLSMAKLSVTLDTVTAEVEGFDRKVKALPSRLGSYRAFVTMKEATENLLVIMPLLRVLTHPAMRPRHWQEVIVTTQTVLEVNSPFFCLENLLSANLLLHHKEIEEVCEGAQQELQCEEQVNEIARRWQEETLVFQNFKNLGPVILEVSMCLYLYF